MGVCEGVILKTGVNGAPLRQRPTSFADSMSLLGAAGSLVDIHLYPIEFLFDNVKGIVANLARSTQREDSLAFGANGEDAVLMFRLQLRRRRRVGTTSAFVLGTQRHRSAVHLALQGGERCLRGASASVRRLVCNDIVPSTTAKAANRIRSRKGNAPAGSSGGARAVASVTTPRMPHQETMTLPPRLGTYSGRR